MNADKTSTQGEYEPSCRFQEIEETPCIDNIICLEEEEEVEKTS